MNIKLTDILNFEYPKDYKVHLANWSGKHQPLDVFVSDKEQWKRWNSWRGERDEFNRKYIFSLIEFYHEPSIWLFGGIFEVLSRSTEKNAHSYEVELTDQFAPMIGRLKIKWVRTGRAKARILE